VRRRRTSVCMQCTRTAVSSSPARSSHNSRCMTRSSYIGVSHAHMYLIHNSALNCTSQTPESLTSAGPSTYNVRTCQTQSTANRQQCAHCHHRRMCTQWPQTTVRKLRAPAPRPCSSRSR
jgi:hypothetical protein